MAATVSTVPAPLNISIPIQVRLRITLLATQLRTVARIIEGQVTLAPTAKYFSSPWAVRYATTDRPTSHADLMARLSHAASYSTPRLQRFLLETWSSQRDIIYARQTLAALSPAMADGTDHGWGAHHFCGSVRSGAKEIDALPAKTEVGTGNPARYRLGQHDTDDFGGSIRSHIGNMVWPDCRGSYPQSSPTSRILHLRHRNQYRLYESLSH